MKNITKNSELQEKLNEVIENQQKRISELEKQVKQAEWNLWLYGLQEKGGENLKERVIAICSAVVPEAADNFTRHIETVQRIGKKCEGKVRPVIIRFTEKSTKELLLKTSSSLKFAEDGTAKDKDRQQASA